MAPQILRRGPLQNLGPSALLDLLARIEAIQEIFVEPYLDRLHGKTLAGISGGVNSRLHA
jgi:hypothetical protein